MARFRSHAPVEPRSLKRCFGVRVGNPLTFGRVGESRKMRELISPTLGDCSCQVLLEIAEKKEWCFSSKLFPHEEKWRRGREQQDRSRRPHSATVCKFNDSLSESSVSDLIMILKKGDKCGERQTCGGFTTRFAIPIRGSFTLIRESGYQAAAQLIESTFRIV